MRTRSILTVAAGLALGSMLPGVSRAQAQNEQRVRIGQSTTSLSFLPIWAARALDLFKPQGLALDWAAIPGGDPSALAALDSGDIDFAAVGSETVLQAISKGQPFVLIYPVMGKMSLELVVSEAFLKRTGVSPADPLAKRIGALKDATLGVSAVRGAQERVARWLIAQGGLDPAKDLKVAMIGPPPAIHAALDHNQIDGFLLSPPEGAITEEAKTGKVLVRLGDEFPKLRNFPFLVLVAKGPIEGAKRDLAVKVVEALIAASEAVAKDPGRVASEIQRRFFAKVAPEVIAKAVESMANGILDPRFGDAQIASALAFTADTGGQLQTQLEAAAGSGRFWTNEIVDAARK
jgi:NitT/TauT family transport system substrate-binding protein